MAGITPNDMQVFEILAEAIRFKNKADQYEYLSQFVAHTPLQYIVKFNYCSSIVSMIPEGIPPYNNEAIDGPSRSALWSYIKIFPYFVQTPQSSAMKPLKREQLFIEMLESIDNKEAEVVCLAKDKQLESKYPIAVDMWQALFPQLAIQPTGNVVAPAPVVAPVVAPAPAVEVAPVVEAPALDMTDAAAIRAHASALGEQAKELQRQVRELNLAASAIEKANKK